MKSQNIIPFVLLLFLAVSYYGQSIEQRLPTPVFANQVAGEINARDIGDPRQTSHFYTFNGDQGDLFINIITSNLNADIDLFVEQGLWPLTKIVVYADRGETETGRVIYLRKREKLLLRIQGRTPNDSPGSYRLKFAGGFVAAAPDSVLPPDLPKIAATVEETNRVDEPLSDSEVILAEIPQPEVVKPVKRSESAPVVDEIDHPETVEKESKAPKGAQSGKASATQNGDKKAAPDDRSKDLPVAKARDENAKKARKEPEPDPMANFSLIVIFHDGSRIDRPMTDVSRFQVDKGRLTIFNKNGSISRYSMSEVAKVAIE